MSDVAAAVEAASEVFGVRPMVADDMAFVRDSWLRSAWHAENCKLKLRRVKQRDRIRAGRSWWDGVRPHVTALLEDSQVRVIVACCRETPNHIAAWLAIKNGEPIRMYIKQAYRGFGVDRLLKESM